MLIDIYKSMNENITGSEGLNVSSQMAWERSASAPCGVYSNDGLRTQWPQPCEGQNSQKADAAQINSESRLNLPCLNNGEIKEEFIDDDASEEKRSSLNNNKVQTTISEANNKSSTNYASYSNESMPDETNTTTTLSGAVSRTNGRKLISPSQHVSGDRFSKAPHETNTKVRRQFPLFDT